MVRGNDLVAFDDVELGGIFAVANKHSIDAGRKLLAAVYCKKKPKYRYGVYFNN